MEKFHINQRVYTWDEYKTYTHQDGVTRYQGGRAYGTIKSINGNKADIKYDDMDDVVEEMLSDLKTDKTNIKKNKSDAVIALESCDALLMVIRGGQTDVDLIKEIDLTLSEVRQAIQKATN